MALFVLLVAILWFYIKDGRISELPRLYLVVITGLWVLTHLLCLVFLVY
jgi:hypothetical protein